MGSIETTGLVKTFSGKGDDVEAVKGVDLNIAEGEIFGFLGPNGAGKSTTVRILTTLLRPTSGTARVAGFDVAEQPTEVRRHVGVALQEAGLDYLQTGRELLALQGELFGMGRRDSKARASELLDLVGLSDAADRRIDGYSGGMRRRLDLASALVHRPRLLFLDEPTAGLDPASRSAIWDEVFRLNKHEGITIFLTTQYLEEADRLADRVAIIDHGTIIAEGSPSSLKRQLGGDVISVTVTEPHVATVEQIARGLGDAKEIHVNERTVTVFLADGTGAVTRLVRGLDERSIDIESLTVTQPSLDEVFLRLTGSRLEGAETTTEDAR
jgi:ABC-2 type transport system ATP-binding protein